METILFLCRAAPDPAQMSQTSQSHDQLAHQSPDSMPDLDDSAGLLDDKDLEHELEESAAEVPNAWCLTSDAASHGDFCRRDGVFKAFKFCLEHSAMESPESFKLQLFCRMLSKESNRLAYTKFQKHIPVLPQGRSRCSS